MRAAGALVALVIACCALTACSRTDPVVLAAANTTTQRILIEIIARRLTQAGIPVGSMRTWDSLQGAHQAVLAHEADVDVEYTGAAWMNVLHHDLPREISGLEQRVRSEYASGLQLKCFESLGFSDHCVLVIRRAESDRIRSISEAERQPAWSLAVAPQFLERADGFPALMQAYPGLRWTKTPERTDARLLYAALAGGRASMIAGTASDAGLSDLHFEALQDDRALLPGEQVCIIARFDSLAVHPGLQAALASLSGRISTNEMRRMNADVDLHQHTVQDVAAAFLTDAAH